MTAGGLDLFVESPDFQGGTEALVGILFPAPGAPPAAEAGFLALLSEAERRRVQDFRSTIACNQYIYGRALVRCALARFTGSRPEAVPLQLTADGKPFLSPDAAGAIEFSLSHKPGCIAVALTRRGEIGVDVEAIAPDRANEKIARHYFASSEVRQLHGLSAEQMPLRFCRFWSLKEAYIKARGLGLRIPLKDFAFAFAEPDRLEQPGPGIRIAFTSAIRDDPAAWQFHTRRAGADHLLSLAIRRQRGEDVRLSFAEIAVDDLLRA